MTNDQDNIANNSPTRAQLNNVEVDTHGLADLANNRITLDRNGIWETSGALAIKELTHGRDFLAWISHIRVGSFTNTVTTERGTSSDQNAGGLGLSNVSISGQSGDHLELYGFHLQGAATPDFNGNDPYSGQVWLRAKYEGAE
jgi:hypothetical protein